MAAASLRRRPFRLYSLRVRLRIAFRSAKLSPCRRVAWSRALRVEAFREKDALMQKVYELKQEQQELDGLCLAQRRAGHAEVLAVEDLKL